LTSHEHAIELQARGVVERILGDVCPARCILLDVSVQAEREHIVKEALPGFEELAEVEETFKVKRISAAVAIDAALRGGTSRGLERSLEESLSSLSEKVEVQLRSFAWPAPKSETPTPILIKLSEESQTASSAETPSTHEVTAAKERLIHGFVEGAPWLAALLIGIGGAALIVWLLRRRQDFEELWDDSVVEESDEARLGTEGKAASITTDAIPVHSAGAQMAKESRLLEQLKHDTFLRMAVLKTALKERSAVSVAQMLFLLGADCLADFHGTHLNDRVQEVYTVFRTMKPLDEVTWGSTLLALESLALDEIREGTVDGRFALLHTLEASVFSSVADALEPRERHYLLLLAPRECRESYLTTAESSVRLTFFREALDAIDGMAEADIEHLAEKVERLAGIAVRKRRLSLRAASALNQCLVGMGANRQERLLQQLRSKSDRWRELIDSEVFSERDLLESSNDGIEDLIVSAKPELLVDFLATCSEALGHRIEAKVPSYMRPMVEATRGHELDIERAKRARTHVFAVWKRRVRAEQYRRDSASESIDVESLAEARAS
jgi:hypothetical protein